MGSWGRLLAPLSNRDFALLWAGQTFSTIGDFIFAVALPVSALSLGASAVELGALVAIFASTQVALLILGGAVVDRASRRTVLMACDLARAVAVGIAAWLALAHELRLQHLYVLQAALGFSSAFFQPALRAIAPQLLPPTLLPSANALRSSARLIGRALGPVAGAILIVSGGPGLAFAANAASFAVGAATLALIPAASAPRAASTVTWRAQLGGGLHYARAVPWIWTTIALFALWNAAFNAAQNVTIPLLALPTGGPELLAAMYAAYAVGQVVAILALVRREWARPGLALYGFAALTAVAIAAAGALTSEATLLVLWCVSGIGVLMATNIWETLLQQRVPAALLGRVGSVDLFGSFVFTPLAPYVAGALVSATTAALATVALGLVGVATCVFALALPAIRDLRAPTAARASST